jgi:NhaP-type Na+/H+ and K+/H+ antiporter
MPWGRRYGRIICATAIYPLLEGIPKADLIYNLVFFISVTSVLLQGTTFLCGKAAARGRTRKREEKDWARL